jgi:hypothetical protein
MRQFSRDKDFELAGKLVDSFGWKVEPKNFQGDKLITARVVDAEYGSESASSDGMKDVERTDRFRRRRTNNVGVQCGYSSMEGDSS